MLHALELSGTYSSICFQIEWDMIVVTVFLLILGSIPIKDTQTPPPFRNSHIYMKLVKDAQCAETKEKQIFLFLFCTQNSRNHLNILTLITDQNVNFLVPKDAQCSIPNAELNFRFLRLLVFEIWSIMYSKFLVKWGLTMTVCFDCLRT